jgi:hypothetical protein
MDFMCIRGLRVWEIGLCFAFYWALGEAPALAWAPLENSILSSTKFAPGIINQTFRASRYFYQPQEQYNPKPFVTEDSLYFPQGKGLKKGALKKTVSDEENEIEDREISPLSWTFGLGYQRSESPATPVDAAVINVSLTGLAGLAWDANPFLKPSVQFILDSTNAEAYGHGEILVACEMSIPLKRQKKRQTPEEARNEADYDPSDALQFYAHEAKGKKQGSYTRSERSVPVYAKKEEQEDDDAELGETAFDRWKRLRAIPTPYLKFIFSLGTNSQGFSDKNLRRASMGKSFVAANFLYQYALGVEVVLYFKRTATYTVGFHGYLYNGSVDSLVSAFDMDTFRRQPIVAWSGVSGFDNLNLGFPTTSMDQRGEWKLNEKETLVLEFSEAFYAALLQPPTYAISQTYFTSLAKDWRGGLTGTVVLGGIASPLISVGLLFDYKI